jgi:hypothetical protein
MEYKRDIQPEFLLPCAKAEERAGVVDECSAVVLAADEIKSYQ